MKNLLIFASTILLFTACQPEEDLQPVDPVHDYFKEIALGTEFKEDGLYIRKWANDLNIYLVGEHQPELEQELNKIILELNELLTPVQIRISDDSLRANYFIFFGPGEEYATHFNPEARSFIKENYGLFSVHWNERCEIYQGSMYIDTQRCRDIDAQKHLLREELTQSLGFFNDSFQYASSIFQQQWTYTTIYNEIDRQIISLLYEEAILPCMRERSIDSVLQVLD